MLVEIAAAAGVDQVLRIVAATVRSWAIVVDGQLAAGVVLVDATELATITGASPNQLESPRGDTQSARSE